VEAALPVLERLVRPRVATSLRALVEECWLALGGAAILADAYAIDNVYRYLDVLDRHERHGTLDDVAQLESLLDQERVSSTALARLQIMTMHKAKGLEFDHVLLYGLGRAPRSDDTSVLSWFDVPDEHGEERKIISPVGPRSELDRDPVHRFIGVTEAEKGRNEQARLLYVACTRARKSLHLMGHVNLDRNGEGLRPPVKGSLLRMLWPAVESDFAKAIETFEPPETAVPEATWLEPVLKRIEAPWRTPVPELLPGETASQDAAEPGEEVDFYWVGAGARIAGTVTHRWLQALAEGRAELRPDDIAAHNVLTERWLRELGVGEDLREEVAGRVGEALYGILGDERGRWLLGGEGAAELALTGLYGGNVESVVLDRVRIDANGDHWIVDYKTSSHEGGNLEGFLRAETERYRSQLQKYAEIYSAWAGKTPRCALYFPLLQKFVEV
jgi:ATP-dependent exoDNAse (exonuclease V) beta subunit